MRSLSFQLLLISLLAHLIGCRPGLNDTVPFPKQLGEGLNTEGAKLLYTQTRKACEGVYTIADGSDAFGEELAAKWSHTVKAPGDTTHYMTLFCEPQAAFFILEGRQVGDSLVFEGFWRRLVNSETGTARFVVQKANGGSVLLDPTCCQTIPPGQVVFRGFYGFGEEPRRFPMSFASNRPLNPQPFQILAHRGGGRTSDLLPASENSAEIIRLAPRLGATGVEIDIRQTKDGVPILYHDNQLNLRLTQKNGLIGPIEEYTYKQLSSFVRLINGEKIPTLEEALTAVVYDTPLETVWLDTKDVRDMELVRQIQQTYQQRANALGRRLTIYIGLPSEETVAQFEQLPNHQQTVSLCELDTSIAKRINAKVWAPRWTLGNPIAETRAMQAQGRRVFIWTLDVPSFIEQFINDNTLDGILTNYAPVVAYYHYVKR
ncbi:glycerophosphodiester phosphodiesterase [Fibrella sp. WM1]|uniref:glycerophosphodiester phosphodiesterase n=1 Tax=Fibrella musci TaxID=3242485 RepID=UPI003520796B